MPFSLELNAFDLFETEAELALERASKRWTCSLMNFGFMSRPAPVSF